MTLTELRCPRCDAPLDAAEAGLARCRYCGATLQHVSESGQLTVHLDDVGADKIAVIHAVYYQLRIGLKASKDLVETAPCVLGEAMEAGAAKTFVAALTKAGAKVRAT